MCGAGSAEFSSFHAFELVEQPSPAQCRLSKIDNIYIYIYIYIAKKALVLSSATLTSLLASSEQTQATKGQWSSLSTWVVL